MECLIDESRYKPDRRRKTPWLPIAGSILLHTAILWWLTGTLEAGLPQIQTPFVVDLVKESAGEKTDVQSGQGRTDPRVGEGEEPLPPQEVQPIPQEDRSASTVSPVAEAAAPQELSGEEMILPAPDEVSPERNEDILNALQKELLSRSSPALELPQGRTSTPSGGGEGVPGALGSSAGITGPLGQRTLRHLELPEYPAWARRQGIEASIRFRFWVSPEGDVIRIETIHRSGYPELESLGREALLHWLFAPLPQGEFQEEWGEVPILWRLTGTGDAGVATQEEP
ncbi:MAG: TonB family protein [Candidatus Eisenbacteria bacterium]|uniref:TonB family protein n=1 Tax=Eiseniibacteriota bacterium TaxID=2212470 RepID=A0A948RT14_UNCEI|nr:TonB family protein [Candidatus Eisenbacteria bacterium]MBU1948745.1 TonB family protein [Candidatus Eisenbacteria bacterium]MBU2690470.1 TonB family protein [Candidatus Eisenbacteria bacterium]